MCVAIPGRVVAIGESAGPSRPAWVSFGIGPQREVDLAMLPEVGVGDFVIVHSGFAVSQISEESAAQTYQLLQGLPDAADVPRVPGGLADMRRIPLGGPSFRPFQPPESIPD